MKAIKFLSVLSFMVFTIISCTNDFEDINTNPNAQVIGSNEGLFLGAQIGASREFLDNINSFNGGMAKWAQYYNENLEPVDFIPQNPREDYNDFWVYQNMVTQTIPLLERILDNTESTPHPNYRAATLVMKAWIYGNLTELMGPIPFSDAQQGEVSEEEQFNKPKFDSQEDILKGIIALLEEANGTFDLTGDPGIAMNAQSDAFGGGDILKWKKFTNSLRARILLRISDIDPVFAQAGLEEIFSSSTLYPVLESSLDNFGITWEGNSGSYADPLAQYVNDNDFAPNVVTGFLNILGERQDPRMKILVAPAAEYTNTETYVGLPPAFDEDNPSGFTRIARDSVSHISSNYTDIQLRPIITYSELLFIKAEAALKGYNVGTTTDEAYEAGITANMENLGVSASDITTYLQSPMIIYDSSSGLEQIITQRYIAQFGQSTNTFSMIRRTGFPKLDFFEIGFQSDNGYPVRIGYPLETMQNFNAENFEAAIQGVTIINSVFGDKLWFAQNAPPVQMNPTLQSGPVLYSY